MPSDSDGVSMERRRLLERLALVWGGLLAAMTGVPLFGAVLSPWWRRAAPAASEFLPAIRLKDLPVGVPKRVELIRSGVDGWNRQEGPLGMVWLLRHPDDSVSALSSVCPHSGCTIRYAGEGTYACPCHASAFSLDGVARSGPSPRPMDPLPTEVRDHQVFVRYARFRAGIRERQEL